ncbi:MAG: L,D-transpeptidase [Clostridia bacterium]|nr:L,D-transpeptidase [Clostridia bacterium]
MRITVEKQKRLLTLTEGGRILFSCPVALGAAPEGPKQRAGDGRTPEGEYYVCLKKMGKYGPSLGVSYPSEADARRAGAEEALVACIRARAERSERPPWGTALGGEIFIHGGGADRDWTAGCIALSDENVKTLYDLVPLGTEIRIVP